MIGGKLFDILPETRFPNSTNFRKKRGDVKATVKHSSLNLNSSERQGIVAEALVDNPQKM